MLKLFIPLVLAASAMAATLPDPATDVPVSKGMESVVLAGGCFWGVEGVFERVRGVQDAVSGYSGGKQITAHYEIVSTGATGHAESVKVTFDPAQITFGQLLKVYFSVVQDPTELNRQGPDTGTQYRSAIFYTTPEQKRVAEAYIHQLDAAKAFHSKIVTQVVPLQGFYPAEDYHQHFLDKNPNYPYIVYNDMPKIEALKKQFPQLCKR